MSQIPASSIDLNALISDPTNVQKIDPAKIAPLMAQLSAIQASMAARLLAGADTGKSHADETLLTVAEAAQRLGVSTDWLYRRTKSLPFVVRVGRNVRFGSGGIDRFIRSRMGR